MVLPAPTTTQPLPSPTSGLPMPDVDPAAEAIANLQFGMGVGGGGYGLSGDIGSTIGAYTMSPVGQAMDERRKQLLASAGMPEGADPNAFTPEEAMAQVDTAIAKIATINPELAESLEEARKQGGDVETGFGENIPLLGGLIGLAKDTLGTAWNFATGVSRVIPELIVDKESDPWYEDIGQALTGKSHANWNAVLQKAGAPKSPFTALLGFGLDVGLDPLTYLTAGAMGLGRGAANIAVGKAAGVSGLRNAEASVVKELLAKSGSETIEDLVTKAASYGTTGPKILGKLNPDAVAGHLFKDVSAKGAELWARNWRVMGEVAKITRRGSFRDLMRLAKKDGYVTLAGERVRPDQILELLEAQRKLGGMAGREAAAAIGGVRIRAGLPFSQMRYTSGNLKGMENMSFQMLRRFFTGDSGLTLLSRRIAKGVPGVSVDDYSRWMEGGWQKAFEANPDALGRWGHGFGSAVFTMSEKVGGITARLTPHSTALRVGGLTGAMVAQHVSKRKYWRNEFIQDVGMQIKDAPTGPVNNKAFTEGLIALDNLKGEANDAAWDLLDMVPTGYVTDVNGATKRGIDDLDAFGAMNDWTPDELQAVKDQVAKVQSLTPAGTIDQLWNTKVVKENTRTELLKGGADMGHWEHNADIAPMIREEERGLFDAESVYAGKKLFLQHPNPNQGAAIIQRGVKSADMVHSGGGGRGLHLIEDAPGVDGVEVAVKVLPGENGLMDEAWEEARSKADSAYDDINPKDLDGEGQDVVRTQRGPATDDHLTAFATQRRTKSVEWVDDQGRRNVVVYDADRVQAIHPKAPNVKRNRGYADRVLHRDFLEMLRGTSTKGVVQARVQDTARSMVRETGHLSRKEAADMIRANAVRQGFDPSKVNDVWETKIGRGHAQYVSQAADTLTRRAGGNLTAELSRWGAPMGPSGFGDAVEDTVYQGARALGLRVLRGLSKKAQKAESQYNLLLDKADIELIRHSMFQAEQMAQLAARHGDLLATAPRNFREEFEGALAEAQMLKQLLDDAKNLPNKGGLTLQQVKGNLDMVKAKLKALAAESGQVRPGLRLPEGMKVDIEDIGLDSQGEFRTFAITIRGETGTVAGAINLTDIGRGQFRVSGIRAGEKRQGLGTQLYLRAARLAKQKNAMLVSDASMSSDAVAAWDSFVSRGWARKVEVTDSMRGAYEMHNAPKLTAPTGAKTRREIFAPSLREMGVNLGNVGTILRNAEQTMAEVNRLRTLMHTEEAAPKLAMVTEKGAKDRRGWMPIDFPDMSGRGTERFWMPAPLAEEFHGLLARHKDYNGLRKFFRDAVMPRWKTWATVMYPGFHFRNMYGAMFNNFLSGMGLREMDESFRIQRAMQGKEKWVNKAVDPATMKLYGLGQYKSLVKDPKLGFTYGDWGDLAKDTQLVGVNAGALGDIYAHADAATTGWRNRRKTPLGRASAGFIKGWKEWGGKAMTVTETYARLGAWTTGMRTFGGDLGQARMFTMSRHGDYVDLNDFEAGGVRDILPFYKWMRTNTPLQIHALFEAPGKTLLWPKLRDFFWNAQGMDREEYQKYMPSWMRNQFQIPIPLGKGPDDVMQLMTFDLPMSDLHKGMNEYLSAGIPVLRPFIEAMILEKNLFTDAPLKDKYVPMGGPMKVLGPMLGAVGLAQRNTEGQWEILQKTEHIMTGIPIYTKVRNWVTADPERVEKRMGSFMSSLFGLNTRPLDEQDMTGVELQFFFTQVQPLISQLKSLGAPLPTKADLDPSLFAALGYDLPEGTK